MIRKQHRATKQSPSQQVTCHFADNIQSLLNTHDTYWITRKYNVFNQTAGAFNTQVLKHYRFYRASHPNTVCSLNKTEAFTGKDINIYSSQ